MSWKARIEWVSSNFSTEGVGAVYSVETLTGTGATVVSTGPAPAFPSVGGKPAGRGQARITVISGAALLGINDATPTEAESLRVATGQEPLILSVAQGAVLSFAESADTGTQSLILSTELTRSADTTTAYAISDALAGASANTWLQAFDVSPLGGSVRLTRARLTRNVTTNNDVQFRGYVYDQAVTQLADNAAFNLTYANTQARRGTVEFTTPLVATGTAPDCLEFSGLISDPAGILIKPADGVVRIGLVVLTAGALSTASDLYRLTCNFERA